MPVKISGVTIIKNAVINGYPIVEAVSSILPVVDEMIVAVGDCDDGTEDLVRSVNSAKIKIVHSVWDASLREGGRVLAVETDKAIAHVSPGSDWVFYIQADEVVHEQYHPAILQAAASFKEDKAVEGLLFNYLHFYGSYNYVGDSRKWYSHEIRIIRNGRHIKAYRDAQGFRKNDQKLHVKPINAFIYHYGWVKSPEQMKKKIKNFSSLYASDAQASLNAELFNYNDFDSIELFKGTHPAVMQRRVAEKNWQLELDVHQKKMSPVRRLLYFLKKRFNIHLFEYRNYRIIK